MAKKRKAKYNAELSAKYSKGSQLKDCFRNCFALIIAPEKLGFPVEQSTYIEGYVHSDGGKFPHGWLELDGALVDPTRYAIENSKDVWQGEPVAHSCDDWSYQPIFVMTPKQAIAAVATDQFPVIMQRQKNQSIPSMSGEVDRII